MGAENDVADRLLEAARAGTPIIHEDACDIKSLLDMAADDRGTIVVIHTLLDAADVPRTATVGGRAVATAMSVCERVEELIEHARKLAAVEPAAPQEVNAEKPFGQVLTDALRDGCYIIIPVGGAKA